MNTSAKWNPTPISKLVATLFLSVGLTSTMQGIFTLFTVLFICLFFALNKRAESAVKIAVFYGVVVFSVHHLEHINSDFVKNYLIIFLAMIEFFFLPILAGKFLIATSEVSSLIVSFEKMRFPKVLIIPIAVMFRYFPAFKDDKKNIKMAMKMRGITHWNPIKYLEYVSVPMLISATNIADDISKAAETKCIADPCDKVRYEVVKFGFADVVYLLGIISINILGRIYA